MIGVINKATNEKKEFGTGFVALKEMCEFLASKNLNDFHIFLGRFESERKDILASI